MAVVLQIKVMPSSGKHEWILDKKGNLRCYLKSAPERGQANQELIRGLAKALKIPVDSIKIISGATIPNKQLKIDTPLSYQDIVCALGLEVQKKII